MNKKIVKKITVFMSIILLNPVSEYFIDMTSLIIGSEDLVKTNSHPGDPYSLIVEVSKDIFSNAVLD